MRFNKTPFVLAILLLAAGISVGQDKDKSLGAIKGQSSGRDRNPGGVTVVVRRGEAEVTRATTE